MRVGDGADAVPVGAVADEVGGEDRLGAGREHRLDGVDVDVVGVGLHVDERGHDAGAHERCDVGGEGDRGGDHLVAGLAPEQLDREVQRGGTRVAHDPVPLAEVLGHALLERLHVLADAQRRRTAAQNFDDGLDLLLAVHAPRVLDAPLVGPHDDGLASSLNTRMALSRRNLGHTWSRNGTLGISVKMRSRLRPIG